jgi:flagellar biosynthesis protein FlhG
LIRQFHTLGRHADIVVIDVGGGAGKVLRQFAQAASDVVMVTTPDSVSIMDTYATIKTLHSGQTTARLHLLVNQAADDELARDVHHRLDRSCHRFLALHVDYLGWIPAEPTALDTTKSGGPAILRYPDTPLSSSITKLAWQLTPQRDAQSGGRAAA